MQVKAIPIFYGKQVSRISLLSVSWSRVGSIDMNRFLEGQWYALIFGFEHLTYQSANNNTLLVLISLVLLCQAWWFLVIVTFIILLYWNLPNLNYILRTKIILSPERFYWSGLLTFICRLMLPPILPFLGGVWLIIISSVFGGGVSI